MYRKIVNVDALFVIFTSDDRNTVIGRSGVENIHIGQAMAIIGGGGHAGAGSAAVKNSTMSPQQIKETIVAALYGKPHRECPHLRHHVFSGHLCDAIDAHARGPGPDGMQKKSEA